MVDRQSSIVNRQSSTRTTCPYCGVGCQIDLRVRDDRIVRVDAPYDAAPNYGRLCVKGRFGLDFVHHPSRLTAPLIRRVLQTARSAYRRVLARRVARSVLGRSARPGGGAPARSAPPLRAGQHHRERLRQSDQRGQLPAPEVPACGHRHQQHRSLRPAVPRGQRRGAATGPRLQRDEQRHRRDARSQLLHGHRLEHRRDASRHRDLPKTSRPAKRRSADRRRSSAD